MNRSADTGKGASLLRAPGERNHQVTPIELFFDLVYVFAITQLSHHLLDHLDMHGALQTLLLLVAVWTAWIYAAWLTNWFDPNQRAVRLLLVGMMLVSLLMSSAMPEAFGERGLLFAAAYVTMHVGRALFAVAALRNEPGLRLNFVRILSWSAGSSVLWLAGGFVEGTAREVLWRAAVAVDLISATVGFYTPGLGRSHTSDWNIAGEHVAERCRLFIILALGESILVTGATFANMPVEVVTLAAFVAAFLGSVALWWVYFDRTADYAAEVIARSSDPGRLGRSAYSYDHLPMVAGIIVTAVGDELIIAHPTGSTDLPTAAVVLGGPALFLIGHALFKRAVFGLLSIPRAAAVVALALLVPVSLVVPPIVLAAAATLIVGSVAAWDTWLLRNPKHIAAIIAAKEEGA